MLCWRKSKTSGTVVGVWPVGAGRPHLPGHFPAWLTFTSLDRETHTGTRTETSALKTKSLVLFPSVQRWHPHPRLHQRSGCSRSGCRKHPDPTRQSPEVAAAACWGLCRARMKRCEAWSDWGVRWLPLTARGLCHPCPTQEPCCRGASNTGALGFGNHALETPSDATRI